jgi:hypothetical protein
MNKSQNKSILDKFYNRYFQNHPEKFVYFAIFGRLTKFYDTKTHYLRARYPQEGETAEAYIQF